MQPPFVSIIIPAYNEANWISKTLDAALLQKYPNYEIIVIDNASIDATKEIVASIAAKNQKIILLEESRQGTQFARERGRQVAKGEILAQLDADALPPIDWLARGVHYFENKKIVAVGGPIYYYDGSFFVKAITYVGRYTFWLLNFFGQVFKAGASTIGGNTFIRASALARVGGYNTKLTFYADDADTASRLAKIGKVKCALSLSIKMSARRYNKLGFFFVQIKYTNVYVKLFSGKKISAEQSKEVTHPR